jgi:hypothetical protein
MRRAGLRTVGIALALGALVAPSAAVAATDTGDGRWYYDIPRLAEVHQQTTGTGITIGLVDGRINTAVPDLAGADVQVREPSYCAAVEGGEAYPAVTTEPDAEHATSMATMLVGTDAGLNGQPGIPGVAPGASLRVYVVAREDDDPCEPPAGQPKPPSADATSDQVVRDAIADGVDIIVVPGARRMTAEVVAEAQRAGVIVIGSAGNDTGIVTGKPATYNGVVSTGTVTSAAELDLGSPSGERLGVVAPGAKTRAMAGTWDYYGTSTGSSNSAAYTAGALALAWSAHPDATANQILQALARTAGGTVKDTPVHDDDWGYGLVNARTLVSVDPTTYPDENPFLSGDPGLEPLASDVVADDSPQDSATADDAAGQVPEGPDGAPADETAGEDQVPTLAIAGGAVALIALAGIATAVVLARRRRDTTLDPLSHDTQTPPTYSGGHHG